MAILLPLLLPIKSQSRRKGREEVGGSTFKPLLRYPMLAGWLQKLLCGLFILLYRTVYYRKRNKKNPSYCHVDIDKLSS